MRNGKLSAQNGSRIDGALYLNAGEPAGTRAADLLSRLKVEEKAAQMMCVRREKATKLLDAAGDFDELKARRHFGDGRGIVQIGRTRAWTYAPTIPLLWAIFAAVVDYVEWKTGRRTTGVIYATFLFAFKAGHSLGGALGLWMLRGERGTDGNVAARHSPDGQCLPGDLSRPRRVCGFTKSGNRLTYKYSKNSPNGGEVLPNR